MKYFIALLSIFINYTAFADTPNNDYRILVDAGSSGSRLHVFQHHVANPLPDIKEVYTTKISGGLANFATHPQDAGDALKPALDNALQYLTENKIDPQQISIDIMGTAGMRLLPQDQQAGIYSALNQYLTNHYVFNPGQIRTLSGKEEALFGWLDVNYLNENLQRNTNTIGSMDMGGASTEIAYEVNSPSDARIKEDTYYIKLGIREYAVYAKSYLGLGQDQARAALMKNITANACFPLGYQDNQNNPPITGQFSQPACKALYENFIQQHPLNALPKPKNNEFLAYSGFYFAYNFFNLDRTPEADLLNIQIDSICNKNWNELQKDYPNISVKFLSSDCANGIYISTLLYQTYHLNAAKLWVSNQIQGTEIDWPLGALLFSLTQKESTHAQ